MAYFMQGLEIVPEHVQEIAGMTFSLVYRFDPLAPLTSPAISDNTEALQRLAQGNQRFSELVHRMHESSQNPGKVREMIVPLNPLELGVPFISGLAPAHAPFALVLGCADARVPIEHVLDCSANELFVVRVAGNVLGLECLGSVDYAASNLRESLRSVVVMAHTECGAVTAAVDVYLSPSDFGDIAFSHAVRSLIDRIMLSVRGAARAWERHLGTQVSKHPKYREWLIETAVYMNAAVTAYDLQREVDAVTGGKLPVSYCVYDMARTRVTALPLSSAETADPMAAVAQAFAPAPVSNESFMEVANQVVQRIMTRS